MAKDMEELILAVIDVPRPENLAELKKAVEANAGEGEWVANPKGELQVRSQSMNPPRRPEYTLVKTSGKAHKPLFTVRVAVEGFGEATAEAGNRKEAEALAAGILLRRLHAGG